MCSKTLDLQNLALSYLGGIIMKKAIVLGLALSTLGSVLPLASQVNAAEETVNSAVYSTEASTTPVIEADQGDVVQHHLTEISSKYKIGEAFSKEDADYVKKYAMPVNSSQTTTNESPSLITPQITNSKSFSGALGNVKLTGNASVNVNVINNSVSGNIVVSDTTKKYHSAIGSTGSLRCYGLLGENGTNVGLIYNKDYKGNSSNANYNKNVFSDRFTGSVAYYSLEIKGNVDGNSFGTNASGS